MIKKLFLAGLFFCSFSVQASMYGETTLEKETGWKATEIAHVLLKLKWLGAADDFLHGLLLNYVKDRENIVVFNQAENSMLASFGFMIPFSIPERIVLQAFIENKIGLSPAGFLQMNES